MSNLAAWFSVALTVSLTVYGQLIIKWRVTEAGALPGGSSSKIFYFGGLFIDPWIISTILATFIAGIFWMAAMTRLSLSVAYPFTSLAFVLVAIFNVIFMGDALNLYKILGTLLVVIGLCVVAQG
jgi:drug/metabolite transporter (DMT)-like permease